MFSFYPSHPRGLRYLPPVYSVHPDDDLYSGYPSSSYLLVRNPEVRYRRALGEYLAAEEEYNAVLRSHEEANLMARAEAIRQEWARLRLRVPVAQLARARREQQARQFKQGLAKALSRAAISGNDDHQLHYVVPVTTMYQTSERPLSDMLTTSCMYGRASCAGGASVQKEKVCGVQFEYCPHSVLIDLITDQEQRDAEEETNVDQCPLSTSERGECECSISMPNLESVLRERLEKIAGDEEVQDLARGILRHLTSATGVSPSAAASSPEVSFHLRILHKCPRTVLTFTKVNTYSTQQDEGANLSRSYALKGAAAEAAKASFKAHRAEVAEKTEPSSPTSPTPRTAPSSLLMIEDIRSAATKLSAGFSLPPSLDFSDDESDGLAYTSTNAPVRVYEQALNMLLEQLDAVESDGDEEVRVVRRAAVKEIERAIEDVEERVREAKENAGRGGRSELAVSGEADHTEGKNIDGAVNDNRSVNDDRAQAEEASSNSGDSVDSAPMSETLPIPNPEVAIPNVAKPTEPKSVQDDDILKNQSPTPVSGSVVADVPVPSPSPAPSDQIEATVSRDNVSESKHDSELFAKPATSDQAMPVLPEPEILITPPDSPEVSVPMLGAIAPSPTPVAPLVLSIIPDELPVSLDRDRFPVSLGEDDAESSDADGDGEWTEI